MGMFSPQDQRTLSQNGDLSSSLWSTCDIGTPGMYVGINCLGYCGVP